LVSLGSGNEPVTRLCEHDNEFWCSIETKNLSCESKTIIFEEER
jgi:hypothetical protein